MDENELRRILGEQYQERRLRIPRPTVLGGGGFRSGSDLEARLPMMQRQARFMPETFDEGEGTVELVWTTGARVLRMPFFSDPYEEELSLEAGAVRLERLNAGAPLLDSHLRIPIERQIGTIERGTARIVEESEGRALVRFSRRPSLEELRGDVRDGIVSNVSVGYVVHQFRDVTQKGDRFSVFRAIDWEPTELSLVTVPGDYGSMVRGAEVGARGASVHLFPCVIRGAQTHPRPAMDEDEVPQAPGQEGTRAAAEGAEAPPAEAGRQAGGDSAPAPATGGAGERSQPSEAELERERTLQIRQIVRAQGLPETLSDELIRSGASIDAARERVLNLLADRSAAAGAGSNAQPTGDPVRITRDARDKVVDAVENALQVRYGLCQVELGRASHPGGSEEYQVGNPFTLSGEARDLRYFNGIRLAEEMLVAAGVNCRGMGPSQIATLAFGGQLAGTRGMMGTSDFPNVFANVANNALLTAYSVAPRTFRTIARQRDAADFKQIKRSKLSGAPALEEVPEGGEVKRGTMVEEAENYKLKTYSKILALTRQALINDDLNAFMDLAEKFGSSAALLESETVWNLINSNVVLGDGVALFHANHSNVVTGSTPISVTNLGAARALLRKQTDPLGKRMNLPPAYLVVPPDLETIAQQHTGQIQPDSAGNLNPFASVFRQIIVEVHLTSTQQWYVTADPAVQALIEWAYLQGSAGPQIATRTGFEVDGMETKVTLDFGAAVMDHRGFVRADG